MATVAKAAQGPVSTMAVSTKRIQVYVDAVKQARLRCLARLTGNGVDYGGIELRLQRCASGDRSLSWSACIRCFYGWKEEKFASLSALACTVEYLLSNSVHDIASPLHGLPWPPMTWHPVVCLIKIAARVIH